LSPCLIAVRCRSKPSAMIDNLGKRSLRRRIGEAGFV
jgi:hypothetical protein